MPTLMPRLRGATTFSLAPDRISHFTDDQRDFLGEKKPRIVEGPLLHFIASLQRWQAQAACGNKKICSTCLVARNGFCTASCIRNMMVKVTRKSTSTEKDSP